MSKKYRALVVDDEPAVRMVILRELTRSGLSCDVASNGCQAIQLSEAESYDVVVTDLRMPEMNGHEFCVKLLAEKDPPIVVVLTGVTEPRIAKDLLARGVDDIMFKPIDQAIFSAKICALVEKRAARRPAQTGAVDKPVVAPPLSGGFLGAASAPHLETNSTQTGQNSPEKGQSSPMPEPDRGTAPPKPAVQQSKISGLSNPIDGTIAALAATTDAVAGVGRWFMRCAARFQKTVKSR
jgi:CheY-like chemotaxis protein